MKRYDDQRDAGENIDFKSTILSRFDLIFIVKDHRNEARDKLIAEHVIGLHVKGNVDNDAASIFFYSLSLFYFIYTFTFFPSFILFILDH